MKKIIIGLVALLIIIVVIVTLNSNRAKYHEIRDEFTGEDNSVVHIKSSSGDDMTLVWKCSKRDRDLFIYLLHSPLPLKRNGKSVTIQYKFDNEVPSPENEFSPYIGRNRSTFSSSPFNSLGTSSPVLTQKSLSSHKVKIRIIGHASDKKLNAKFKLAGLGEELLKLPCVDSLDPYQ